MNTKKSVVKIISFVTVIMLVAGLVMLLLYSIKSIESVSPVADSLSNVSGSSIDSGERKTTGIEVAEIGADEVEIRELIDESRQADKVDGWANSHFYYEVDYKGHLLQKDSEGNVINQFPVSKLALLSGADDGEDVSIMCVTDSEIICEDHRLNYSNETEQQAVYSVPLSFSEGEETPVYDKKEILCQKEFDFENEDFISYLSQALSHGDYLLCESMDSMLTEDSSYSYGEIDRNTKEPVAISEEKKDEYMLYAHSEENRTWGELEGDYVLLEKYTDFSSDKEIKKAKGKSSYVIYAHEIGSGKVTVLTEQESADTMIAHGDGKYFYTALSGDDGKIRYDVWMYDGEAAENKIIISEDYLVSLLPNEPPENCDLIRALRYQNGKLYIEVRYSGETHVLSYEVETGKTVMEQAVKELVHHPDYQIEKAIKKANAKYSYANDRNLYTQIEGEGIEQRTLDGKYIRTIHPGKNGEGNLVLMYVNNEEMILQDYSGPSKKESEVGYIYSVPFEQIDGVDYPNVSKKKLIFSLEDMGNGAYAFYGGLYANSRYVVYMLNFHEFSVYDRKKKTHIKIKNLPQTSHGFANGQSGIQNAVSDNYAVFNTKPVSESDEGSEYAFSIYKMGDNKSTIIDSKCNTAADYTLDSDKRVIYERLGEKEKTEYCSYDIKSGKKEVLFTSDDMDKLNKKMKKKLGKKGEGAYYIFSMYGEKLYVGDGDFVYTYDFAGDKKLVCDEKMSKAVTAFSRGTNKKHKYWLEAKGVVEGKYLFTRDEYISEGDGIDDDEKVVGYSYFYYDMEKETWREVTKKDAEYLYFAL